MPQLSRIPRSSTNIKNYHPPFAVFSPSGGRQTARTQSLFTSFSPENQDKAAPSAAYKYLRTVFMERGSEITEKRSDQGDQQERPECKQLP
ncbi:hypothetical protein AXF42_Ash000596 [Apostasia shenzhenica]|uniref:Uncharacterized protein n=1 Tax=Apostasia shenzhenica TaxID=1088818 RepID=A0A2I0AGS5_9ASPA|nr:hypothetical protein AXF42_Ash000596 [Apostasia shenzhenica]